MKKILSFVLILGFILSGTIFVFGNEKAIFDDVVKDAWYYEAVIDAFNTGLVNGKTKNLFYPDDEMSYAEAVKLAACLNQKFYDGKVTLTNGEPWYLPYLNYCLEKNIINSDAKSDFLGYNYIVDNFNGKISRREYVYLFARALPDDEYLAINEISDNSIPDVKNDGALGSNEIYKLYKAGILLGSDNIGSFNPNRTIKRREVATVIQRITNKEKRKKFELTNSGSDNGQNNVDFDKILGSEYICGVAFLGYSEEKDYVTMMTENGYINKYPFLKNIAKEQYVEFPGDETYVFVFKSNVKSVTVQLAEMTADDKNMAEIYSEPIYKGENKPIVVRGNISDIFSNICVTVVDENGNKLIYKPSMSLRDGLLSRPNVAPFVYDFTEYNELKASYIGTWVSNELGDGKKSIMIRLQENDKISFEVHDEADAIVESFEGSWSLVPYDPKIQRDDDEIFFKVKQVKGTNVNAEKEFNGSIVITRLADGNGMDSIELKPGELIINGYNAFVANFVHRK